MASRRSRGFVQADQQLTTRYATEVCLTILTWKVSASNPLPRAIPEQVSFEQHSYFMSLDTPRQISLLWEVESVLQEKAFLPLDIMLIDNMSLKHSYKCNSSNREGKLNYLYIFTINTLHSCTGNTGRQPYGFLYNSSAQPCGELKPWRQRRRQQQ
jgi:hypothetical protein